MRIENHSLALSDVEYQRLSTPRTSTVNLYIDDAVHKTPEGLSAIAQEVLSGIIYKERRK
jgi:hypothetical protein